MPPKFTLQPVLDFRHSRVEALEIELAELLSGLQQRQEILNKLEALEMSLLVDLADMQMGEIDLFAVQNVRSNIQIVESRIVDVRQSIQEFQAQVDAKRAEIIQAKQDEETLKTLKEKEIQRYKEEQDKVEARQVDDIYIAQAYRNRKMGESQL